MEATPGTSKNKVIPTDGTTDWVSPTSVATAEGASALTILAAGGAGVKNRIFEVLATADTAGELTISDSVGSIQHISAGGQIVFDFYPTGIKQGTANTALTLTNSGGGNVSAIVKYSADA